MTKTARQNGVAIRCMRIKDGLALAELADRLQISNSHLDNIENERKDASVLLLQRIAAAFTVPVGALLRDPHGLARLADNKASASAEDVA